MDLKKLPNSKNVWFLKIVVNYGNINCRFYVGIDAFFARFFKGVAKDSNASPILIQIQIFLRNRPDIYIRKYFLNLVKLGKKIW